MRYSPSTSLLLVIATCIGLAACGTNTPSAPVNFDSNLRAKVRTVRMPHIIKPEAADMLQTSDQAASNQTMVEMMDFLLQIDTTYADVLMLDIGTNVNTTRVASITKSINEMGLTYGGEARLGPPPAAGEMILYVERSVVEAPECGKWYDQPRNTTQNASLHHGCSSTRALALMVANPRDLISGAEGRGDPGRATAVIRRAREAAANAGGNNNNTGQSLIGVLGGGGGGGNPQ